MGQSEIEIGDDAAYDVEMVRRCLETMNPVHIENTLRNQVVELDRLRARVAELEGAGNALAVAAVKPHEAYWETGLPDVDALDDAARAADAWRSAAGGES